MAIRSFDGKTPKIAGSAYVDDAAVVIGDVTIGEDSSLWPTVVARGDVQKIVIGERTNIQDGSILHVTHDGKFSPGGYPLSIGNDVTAGHRTILHACTIEDRCLIGMGATVMDGAVVGSRTVLAAGALVPTGKILEGGYLWVGSPARRKRELNEEELAFLDYSSVHYAKLKDRHMQSKA